MRNTGSTADTPFTPRGAGNALLEQQNNIKGAYNNWFGTHAATWNPTTFEPQLRAYDQAYRNIAGSKASDSVKENIDNIVYGLAGTPPAPHARSVVAGMTGPRYQDIQERLQAAIKGAGTSSEREALINVKNTLESQLHSSVPRAASDELRNLDRQYSNLETVRKSPTQPNGLIAPEDVKQRSTQQYNLGQGSENARLAQSAERVYTPKEDLSGIKPGAESLAGTAAGLIGGALLGHGYDSTSGIMGGMTGYVAKQAAKHNTVSSAIYYSPPAQWYLGNQGWRPSPSTMADPALVAKVLATSPMKEKVLPAPQE